MKGKVFIAWSGTNHLAWEVQKNLANHDYQGIVGGSDSVNDLFINTTILNEMDSSDQAIFIVTKKNKSRISDNLMFELGYALKKYKPNKIHIFFIDIKHNTPLIPSDIRGLWATELSHKEYADDSELTEAIVQKFLENQKIIIPDEKIALIDSYHSEKDKFIRHLETPQCSEYELAQYVLFFSQAAYLHNEEAVAYDLVCKLTNGLKSIIPELNYALIYAQYHLDILKSIKKDSEELYLEDEKGDGLCERLTQLLQKTNVAQPALEDNEFKSWIQLFICSSLNYAYNLCAAYDPLPSSIVNKHLKASIEYGKQALELCEKLSDNPLNEQCITLQKGYINRNIAVSYKKMHSDTSEIVKHLEISLEMRDNLLGHYETHPTNNKVFDKIELEYFIVASERLEYITDDDEFFKCEKKCEKYLVRAKKNQKEKNFFVDKIEKLLNHGKRQTE